MTPYLQPEDSLTQLASAQPFHRLHPGSLSAEKSSKLRHEQRRKESPGRRRCVCGPGFDRERAGPQRGQREVETEKSMVGVEERQQQSSDLHLWRRLVFTVVSFFFFFKDVP